MTTTSELDDLINGLTAYLLTEVGQPYPEHSLSPAQAQAALLTLKKKWQDEARLDEILAIRSTDFVTPGLDDYTNERLWALDPATPYRVFKDGDKWCAVYRSSFINLQESPAGFGDTPGDAIAELTAQGKGK